MPNASGHQRFGTPDGAPSASGEWCREYSYEIAAEVGKETLHAVACRAAEGRWQTRVPAQTQS